MIIEATRVKFIKFKDEIIALFPDLVLGNGKIVSYVHNGQHGEMLQGFMKLPYAEPAEYYPLLKELRAIYEKPIVSNDSVVILKVM